jgi:hypothetical protein
VVDIQSKVVYRVKLRDDTDNLAIISIGIDCLDGLPDGDYVWDDLPEWMRGKLAVLNILHLPPPPVSVDDVGMRVSERVFWVYR